MKFYGAAKAPTRRAMRRVKKKPTLKRLGKGKLTLSTAEDFHDRIRWDTESNAGMRMAMRRGGKYPYLQTKAGELYTHSVALNGGLTILQDSIDPKLTSWRNRLVDAQANLEGFQEELTELGKGAGTVTLNWILTNTGLDAVFLNPLNAVEDALQETKSALSVVSAQISQVNSYLNNLSKRQQLSQLSVWRGGEDLLLMAENVAKSFGTTQREMLQGWWQMPKHLRDGGAYTPNALAESEYTYLRMGDIKPWQPVCDLYTHRVDPRSWDQIQRRRAGWDASYAGYGTTTMVSSGGTVFFRQPQEGQPGYVRPSQAQKDMWAISKVEDGCLPSSVCPAAPWTSPIKRTKELIGIQTVGISLVKSTQLNAMLSTVTKSLRVAKSKLTLTKTRFNRLDTVLQNASYIIKPQIRLILEATGGAALQTLAITVGAGGGPIGMVVGWVASEIAISAAVKAIWKELSKAPKQSANKAGVLKIGYITVQSDLSDAFGWWKANTTTRERNHWRSWMQAHKTSLESWVTKYDSMQPTTAYIYPRRGAAEWIRLGVAAQCTERMPNLEVDMTGWEPPDMTHGPRSEGESSDRVDDPHAWDSGALTTSFGSYGYVQSPPVKHYGLTKNQWLLVGVLGAGAFYYHKRKK